MKHLAFLLLFTLFLSSCAFAQLDEKIKSEHVIPGVIFKDGKEILVYIKKTGLVYDEGKQFPAPWQFQKEVKFIERDVFEKTDKLKNKHYTSYNADDCDGYEYDTLRYESVKYADMSAVGFNMISKKMFLRRISEDKISLFFHYENPPTVLVGPEKFSTYYIACAEPHLVYRIGANGKLKLADGLNVKKELADCPEIVKKYNDGEYDLLNNSGKKSVFKNILNSTNLREDVRVKVIEDYNKNCK